jgi:hypothetical protein
MMLVADAKMAMLPFQGAACPPGVFELEAGYDLIFRKGVQSHIGMKLVK